MYLAVYVSSAVELFSPEQLESLLKVSRENNQRLNLTGMLLYKDGNFMQLLEGPKAAVTQLMTKIHQDPRHHGMMTLLQQERDQREFPEWSMGFKQIDSSEKLDIPGYSNFMNLPLTSEQFVENPSKMLGLMLNFRKVVG
jgi:hypothetical protein